MQYELYHHGILGMRWGIRRYQNKDGSLTAAGRKRYGQQSNESGASSRKDSTIDALNNLDQYKDPTDKIIAVTQDCIPFGTGARNTFPTLVGDKNLDKRTDEAAILGLKSLEKYRNELGYGDLGREDPNAPYDKWDKEWFLYEDQTIGLGLVADLINRGYTPDQVGKLVDVVSNNEDAWIKKYGYGQSDQTKKTNAEELADDVVFDITWGNYDDALKKFANCAYKVKNGEMKHSDLELYHHGILGMHWGIRRYQNKDGSLTSAGKKRYGSQEAAELDRALKEHTKVSNKDPMTKSGKINQYKRMAELETKIGETVSAGDKGLQKLAKEFNRVKGELHWYTKQLDKDAEKKSKGDKDKLYAEYEKIYGQGKNRDKKLKNLEAKSVRIFNSYVKASEKAVDRILGDIGNEKLRDLNVAGSVTKKERAARLVRSYLNMRLPIY